VALYVDNFLNIPAGTAVPIGHYDRQAGLWKALESGMVLDVLDTSSGSAELDLDGDGVEESAAQLEAVGIDAEERAMLAGIYQAGDSLWRMEVHHFSPYAIGWAYGPPDCVVAPGGKNECDDTEYPLAHARVDRGTSLKNVLEPTAAVESLVYDSGRMPGNEGAFKLEVPITTDQVPPDVKAIQVQVAIAGRVWTLPPESCEAGCQNEMFPLTWDGNDAYGRPVQGEQLAVVRVGYDYDCVQKDTPAFGVGGASDVTTNVDQAKDGCVATLWREDTVQIGVLNPKAQGLGGYTPASYHMYDPDTETFYSGEGSVKSFKNVPSGVQVFAGQAEPGKTDDLIPAKDSYLDYVAGLATYKDGSVYLSDRGNSRIVRVRPDRLVETVLSGVDATSVAVGPDGSLYFLEGRQVLRRTPDGTVAVIAGSGEECGYTNELPDGSISPQSYFDCNDGVALQAAFQIPLGLTAAPDGSVYVSDVQTKTVRQITPSGEIWTVAGSGEVLPEGVPGDGLAASTPLLGADGIAVAPDGSLLIVEGQQFMPWNLQCYRVRRVDSGWMKTVAGFCTCYGSTCDSQFEMPTSIAVDGEGTIYVQEFDQIRKIDAEGHVWKTGLPAGDICESSPDYYRLVQRAMAIDDQGSLFWVNGCHNERVMWQPAAPTATAEGEIRVPSDDGSVVHVFGPEGQIRRTVSPYLGTQLRTFEHTADKKLAAFEDQFGNRTTLNRSGPDGDVASILGPYGHATTIGRDANGYLNLAKDPAQNETSMGYDAAGLLSSSATGLGGPSCGYYTDGELRVIDQEGGYLEFATQSVGDVYTTDVKTKMGRTSRRETWDEPGASFERVTGADGKESTDVYLDDHTWEVTTPDLVVTEGVEQPHFEFGWEVPQPKAITTTMPSGLSRTVSIEIEGVSGSAGSSGASTTDMGPYPIIRQAVTVNGGPKPSLTVLDLTVPPFGTLTTTSPENRQVVTEFGPGRLPKRVKVPALDDEVHATVVYEYDDHGRVTKVIRGARITEYVYDAGGGLQKIIDGRTEQTLVEYENDERQLPHKITWAEESFATLTHDAHGNTSSVTPPGRPTHSMPHSSLGQLLSYQPPGTEQQSAGDFVAVYGYNDDHQPTGISFQNVPGLTIGYDVYGRIETMETWGRRVDVGYYPSTGQLHTLSSGGETITYHPDGYLPKADVWSGPIEASIYRDFNGKFELRTEKTSAAGSTNEVVYAYDDDGLLTSASGISLIRNLYLERVDAIVSGKLREDIQYNQYGEVKTRELWFDSGSGWIELLNLAYTPDTLGRIHSVTERIDGGSARTTVFGYHTNRGMLMSAKVDGTVEESYEYDPNGNREYPDSEYDAQDRLARLGNITFEYDIFGNLAKEEVTTGGLAPQVLQRRTYDYDLNANLNAFEQHDLTTNTIKRIEYGIDPEGRRMSKTVDSKLKWKAFYRSALQPAAWIDVAPDGTETVSHFVYANDRNSPDLMIRDGQVYRLVTDHAGSVRLVVNTETGDIAQRIDYDSWGWVTNDTEPGFQPFGFGGGIYDRDTGLVRFGTRDYDPSLGRWVSKDPERFEGGTNLYLYAGGDPVNYVDPGGDLPIAAWALIGMVATSALAVDSSDDTAGHILVAEVGLDIMMLGETRRACFATDTPVLTAEGERPIQEVRQGDLVWARDDTTGRTELRPVTKVFVTPDKPLLALVVEHGDGTTEVIRATEEHQFASATGGWMTARMLEPGQQILTASGADARVVTQWTEPGQHTVYNLEVEGLHTYFVGDGGLWVHNTCGADEFGFHRVRYGSHAASELAMAERMADRSYRGNLAVLGYLDDAGREVLSPVFRSAKGVHSEEFAMIWRAEQKIPYQRLTRIFTEYSPCGRSSANCRRLMQYVRGKNPNFMVTYTWKYDKYGRAAKREFLKGL
jgi:RHS repeat-associated protein